jgi:hypothetical protein
VAGVNTQNQIPIYGHDLMSSYSAVRFSKKAQEFRAGEYKENDNEGHIRARIRERALAFVRKTRAGSIARFEADIVDMLQILRFEYQRQKTHDRLEARPPLALEIVNTTNQHVRDFIYPNS